VSALLQAVDELERVWSLPATRPLSLADVKTKKLAQVARLHGRRIDRLERAIREALEMSDVHSAQAKILVQALGDLG
jgi:hypothetical protein